MRKMNQYLAEEIKSMKEIGKIKGVYFGLGGYDNVMMGITFSLGGESWGIGDFWGWWSYRSEGAQWSENDALLKFGSITVRISKLLKEANVKSVEELKNIPIEATFKSDGSLESWRILKEVL